MPTPRHKICVENTEVDRSLSPPLEQFNTFPQQALPMK